MEKELGSKALFFEDVTDIIVKVKIKWKEHFHGKKSDFHTGTGRRY